MSTKTKELDIELPQEYPSRDVKAKITTWVDEDVLFRLKEKAKDEGSKYQTLLNQILREHLFEEESIVKRVLKLERAVFKKAK